MTETRVEKIEPKQSEQKKVGVGYFSNYKGKPMVYIQGPFFGGGFHISKAKAKAILECSDQLKDFFEGKFDEQIKKLTQEEILKING